MATYKSQQLQLVADNATGTAPTKQIPASQYRTTPLDDIFLWNTDDPSSALANADVIDLVELPAGARTKEIRISWEAMGSDQEAEIGIKGTDGSGKYDAAETLSDDADFFNTASIDVSAAGEITIGILEEDNPLFLTDKAVTITMTVSRGAGTSTWAADKDVKGYVSYYDVTG